MTAAVPERAIWHDLECGGYTADLALWHELAASAGGRVLDVGAGTGRVALALARAGHAVTAIDVDAELLACLRERAAGLDVHARVADARSFRLGTTFALCAVPMQTIQLLGGSEQRASFLCRAREHLVPGGLLAVAIVQEPEPFEVTDVLHAPLPDVCEREGSVYSSMPIAVRACAERIVLERRRETVSPAGELIVTLDVIALDRLDSATLERECEAAGLRSAGRLEVAATDEHTGSTVVIARAR